MKTARQLVIVMLVFLPWLTACTKSDFPFEAQKARNAIEVKLWVLEHRSYVFNLRFMYKEEDLEDRLRVKKLVGEYNRDNDGKLIEPGIPILLRLKIDVNDDSGLRPMLDREISELMRTGHGSDFYDKEIAAVILKPGHYRIMVESVHDVPELIGTPVMLHIGRDPRKISMGSTRSMPGYLLSMVFDFLPY